MNIRLEYSPTEGELKQIPPGELKNHSLAFQTLCCYISSQRANQFQERIMMKYPTLKCPEASKKPSLQAMKDELNLFMEEVILSNEITEPTTKNPVEKSGMV